MKLGSRNAKERVIFIVEALRVDLEQASHTIKRLREAARDRAARIRKLLGKEKA